MVQIIILENPLRKIKTGLSDYFLDRQVYTFSEYKEITQSKELDTLVGEVLKVPRLKKMAVFITASILIVQQKVYANDEIAEAFRRIDMAGGTIFDFIRKIGYWICVIMCAIEILKSLCSHKNDDIIKIVFKYICAFATFYVLIWIFDSIKLIFK